MGSSSLGPSLKFWASYFYLGILFWACQKMALDTLQTFKYSVNKFLKQEILSIVVAMNLSNSWANDFIAIWRRSSLSVRRW